MSFQSQSFTAKAPPDEMAKIMEDVRCQLQRLLRRAPSPLKEALLASGGKLNRARLLVACAGLAGGVESLTVSLAVAVELLHWASLLQDDIIDHSPVRRDLPAIHHRFGNGAAILVADWFFSEAYQRVNQAGPAFVTQFNRAVKNMALGELCQMMQPPARMGKLAYLRYSYRKTAIFFEICARLGVDSIGGTRELSRNAGRVGFFQGLAYQLQNDLHDILTLTNRKDQDRHNGICTFPLILLGEKTGLSFDVLEKMNRTSLVKMAMAMGVIEGCLTLEKRLAERAAQILEQSFFSREQRDQTGWSKLLFSKNG